MRETNMQEASEFAQRAKSSKLQLDVETHRCVQTSQTRS